MKKVFALVLAMVMAFSLVACGTTTSTPASESASQPASEAVSAPESESAAEGAVKTGMGVVTSAEVKTEASADEDGKVQTNSTVAVVLVDAEGKILDAKLDVAQINTTFTTEGAAQAAEEIDVRSKMEKGADYGMAGNSAIGKEWNEQADAFAAYVVGMTADEVAAIPQLPADQHEGPDVADLTASCTMGVTEFKNAIVAAVNNAQELGASAGDKLGLGLVTVAKTTAADADTEGSIQHDTTYAVTTTNTEGKITSSYVDVSQTKYALSAEGVATAPEAVPTKHEKGADYGMAAQSAIGKEWFEQADAFAAYVVGMSADEVAAIPQLPADQHEGPDVADLAASCTMNVTEFKAALAKAAA